MRRQCRRPGAGAQYRHGEYRPRGRTPRPRECPDFTILAGSRQAEGLRPGAASADTGRNHTGPKPDESEPAHRPGGRIDWPTDFSTCAAK